MNQKRLFLDMDGTLAEWQEGTPIEKVCEPGYFANIPPNQNVVTAAMLLYASRKQLDVELFTLSAVFDDGHSIRDKNIWLDRYVPFIDTDHRLFASCDKPKHEAECFVKLGNITRNDYLLDDYTKNIIEWNGAGGTAIKLFNGVNGRSGVFHGAYTCSWLHPEAIVEDIKRFMEV